MAKQTGKPDPPRRRAPSDRTRVIRGAKRAQYDPAVVYGILDDTLVCNVATVSEGSPICIPTAHFRVEDRVFIHGSMKNRALAAIAKGAEVCITATAVDGLVLARSAFHHSMNYRSVILYARGTVVTDTVDKLRLLDAFVEKLVQGRSKEARAPNDGELAATMLIGFSLTEASAKCRQGGPIDDDADLTWPVWAGVIPICEARGTPIPDLALKRLA